MVTVKLVMILMKRKFVAEFENISMGRMAANIVALLNSSSYPPSIGGSQLKELQ